MGAGAVVKELSWELWVGRAFMFGPARVGGFWGVDLSGPCLGGLVGTSCVRHFVDDGSEGGMWLFRFVLCYL